VNFIIDSIKKISAITLLYEETEKRLATTEKSVPVTFEKLSEISREALKLHDVRMTRLPSMRVLTSRLTTGQVEGLDELYLRNMDLCPSPDFAIVFSEGNQTANGSCS
jgi:hypothetical protein